MSEKTHVTKFVIVLSLLVLLFDTRVSFGKDIEITVSNNLITKKIIPLIHGNNIIGYDPTLTLKFC